MPFASCPLVLLKWDALGAAGWLLETNSICSNYIWQVNVSEEQSNHMTTTPGNPDPLHIIPSMVSHSQSPALPTVPLSSDPVLHGSVWSESAQWKDSRNNLQLFNILYLIALLITVLNLWLNLFQQHMFRKSKQTNKSIVSAGLKKKQQTIVSPGFSTTWISGIPWGLGTYL